MQDHFARAITSDGQDDEAATPRHKVTNDATADGSVRGRRTPEGEAEVLAELHGTPAEVSAWRRLAYALQHRAAQRLQARRNKPTPVSPSRTPNTPKPPTKPTRLPSCLKPLTSRARASRQPTNDNAPSRPWDRSTRLQKLQSIGKAAEAAGAFAFTVMTSAKREASLRQAAADGRDVRQIIADEIGRQFRKRGIKVPALLFGIELAPVTNRLHIHGFYVPTCDEHRDADRMRDVFTHALGKVKGQAGSTQFKAEPLYTPDAWVAYFRKRAAQARNDLNLRDTVYVSNRANRLGRDWHEAARRASAKSKAAPAEAKAANITPPPDNLTTEERKFLARCLADLDMNNVDERAPAAGQAPTDQTLTFPGREMTNEELDRLFADLDDLDMTPSPETPIIEPIDAHPDELVTGSQDSGFTSWRRP